MSESEPSNGERESSWPWEHSPGLKTRLRGSRPVFGTWVQMASPETCEVAAGAGFDFVIIDMEHGSFGWEAATEMIRATQLGGACPMVRIKSSRPDTASEEIGRALDAGAFGVVVPMVNDGNQARILAAAARYPPIGTRGACPVVRATWHGLRPWKDYRTWSNDETVVWGIIEQPSGVENIDEIIEVLDGVVLGAFDLAVALGVSSRSDSIRTMLARVAGAAAQKNRHCVPVIVGDKEAAVAELDYWSAQGCRVFSLLSDRYLLSQGFGQQLAVARERLR